MEADPKKLLAPPSPVTLDGKSQTFKPFYVVDKIVYEGSGLAIATAFNPDEARRIAAALNAAYGIPTEALEAWSIGSIQDPIRRRPERARIRPRPAPEQDRRGTRGSLSAVRTINEAASS